MFEKFFNKEKTLGNKETVSNEQAVIVHINLSNEDTFDFGCIKKIEENINNILDNHEEYDGNDLSDDECIFYIYSQSAKDTFNKIRNVFVDFGFDDVYATLRYGDVDDENAKTEEIKIQ